MRFLADENIPMALMAALRQHGHDVVAAGAIIGGSADREVAARAAAEGRIVLTFDKDFGAIAMRGALPRALASCSCASCRKARRMRPRSCCASSPGWARSRASSW